MFTQQEVINDLKTEFERLSKRNYSLSGDVNYKEYGGIRYRKKDTDEIEFIYYIGLDTLLPTDEKLRNHQIWSLCTLDDIIPLIDSVWDWSDGKNCGFNIGELLYSLIGYYGIDNI